MSDEQTTETEHDDVRLQAIADLSAENCDLKAQLAASQAARPGPELVTEEELHQRHIEEFCNRVRAEHGRGPVTQKPNIIMTSVTLRGRR